MQHLLSGCRGTFPSQTTTRRAFLRGATASLLAGASARVGIAADPAPAVNAADVGVTGEVVPELAGFDSFMTQFVAENKLPGAALAIGRGGALVYARGFGLADKEQRQPVQPNSLFRIASCTKPFTSAAVLRLVDQGKLKLADRIWDILQLSQPQWTGARFDARWKEITLLELLQHRGGWDRGKSFDPIGRMHDISLKLGVRLPIMPPQIVEYMLGFPFDFAPGERYAYSNFGYILLGLAIERVSGVGYEDFVRREVLAPLGITQMRLGQPLLSGRVANEVKYYDSKNRTVPAVVGPQIGQGVPVPYGGNNFPAYAAHGGWIASAPDLVRFAAALEDPKSCPILSAASLKQLFTRPPGLAGYDAEGKPTASYYGCGWSVRPAGHDGRFNSWHNGLISGTSTLVVRRFDKLYWAALFNTDANPSGAQPANLIDAPLHRVANAVKHWPDTDVKIEL